MAYKVTVCGIDTSTLPKLTKQQTEQYLQEIHHGDNTHRDYFLMGNMRLVLSIVHRFRYDPSKADDVFQVGCLGLLKALNNFDPGHNVMFSTYAVPMIIGEIRRYLREGTALKVSRSMRDVAYKVMQAKEQLALQNINEPTFDTVAQYLGIAVDEVVCAMDAMADPISLDEPAFADGDESCCVVDQIADNCRKEDSWVEYLDLVKALATLPERERQVIQLRYFEGKTQTEISGITGVSQAQVSRIESSAIGRLRGALC